MCKTLLQMQCTNFNPKKVKIEEIRYICNILNQCLLGFLFIVYIGGLRINYCSSMYFGYGD